jgi:predicted membrane protein
MALERLRAAGRNARLTSLVTDLFVAVRRLTDSSYVLAELHSVTGLLHQSWYRSSTGAGATRGLAASNRYLSSSVAATAIQGIGSEVIQTGRRTYESSLLSNLAAVTEDAIRASWLYRWLTAEPEPEVIVIDLRETFSVGPVIALLDQLIRWLVPASHRSTLVGTAESVYEITKSAPVRVMSFVIGLAVLTNLVIAVAVSEPSQSGIIARIVLLSLAALGTRVSLTWGELVQTRFVQLLIAALEPPEPPDELNERD